MANKKWRQEKGQSHITILKAPSVSLHLPGKTCPTPTPQFPPPPKITMHGWVQEARVLRTQWSLPEAALSMCPLTTVPHSHVWVLCDQRVPRPQFTLESWVWWRFLGFGFIFVCLFSIPHSALDFWQSLVNVLCNMLMGRFPTSGAVPQCVLCGYVHSDSVLIKLCFKHHLLSPS